MAFQRRRVPLIHGWQYRAEGGYSCPPSVRTLQPASPPPTVIHQDLLASGIIGDPYQAKVEDDVQWIGEQIWFYTTTFAVPEDLPCSKNLHTELVFEGLDTYATVKLDGRVILETDNMFLTYRVDISDHITGNKPGGGGQHVLELCFDAAEKRGDALVDAHPEHKWTTFNSGLGRLATRKAQYHYGWDWGPKLMTCGPWRPILLEISQSRIVDVTVKPTLKHNSTEAIVDINVDIEGKANHLVLDLEYEGSIIASRHATVKSQNVKCVFRLQNPQLWWPHTHGKQSMYHVNVRLYFTNKDTSTFADTSTKRVGIRSVELIQKTYKTQEGKSFYFKVNGVDVFGAGSNWIPGDLLLPRITAAKYRNWINLARTSNQVMIRIWGGGVYEDAAFYDACDEMGILVWQDFMFACGMFPAYPEFLKAAKQEAEQIVRSLRHHPSIVLWCGNNEDYVIPLLSGIDYDASENNPDEILKSVFPARYTYEHLLPEVCKRLSPEIPYWPGSPYGGEMVNCQESGDIHQWHVWHLEKYPYQDFPKLTGRFVSEFGMQAFPCYRTVLEYFPRGYDVVSKRNWPEDDYVLQHNKAGGGQETLDEYCTSNIPFDSQSLRNYIYATQLIQSETVSTAYRSWRRAWGNANERACGGALVWQLNDCYPVTSWALMDSHLQPKMAFWAMRRENKPITAGLARIRTDELTQIEAWAVNTSRQDVVADVLLRAWVVSTGQLLAERVLKRGLRLQKNQSTELGKLALGSLIKDKNISSKDIVLALDLAQNPGTPLSQNVNFHEPLLEVPFQTGTSLLQVDFVNDASGRQLRLQSAVTLKGVFVEVDGPAVHHVEWSDNGFDLLPNQAVSLSISGLSLSEEKLVRISWLGGEWHGINGLRAAL